MTNKSGERDLTVELVFPQLDQDLDVANITVLIEDAGEADARAEVLARRDFAGVKVPRGTGTVALQVPVPDLGGATTPSIRVRVNTEGTGPVHAGDFLNPGMVPITGRDKDHYRVDLVRVG